MVARRLLLLLAVLMLVSALAAQIAPPPEERGAVSTPSPEPTPSVTPSAKADIREVTVKTSSPRENPIRVRVGDTIRLTVEADELVSVEIKNTDQIETVQPESPAIFNLLVERAGSYPVVVLERDEQIAVIETRR